MTILRLDDNDDLRDCTKGGSGRFGLVDAEAVTSDGANSQEWLHGGSVGHGIDLGMEGGLFLRQLAIWSNCWKRQVQISQRRKFLIYWDLPNFPLLFAILSGTFPCTTASPITGTEISKTGGKLHQFYRRETSTSTLVPAVAICGFLFVIVIITVWKRRDAIMTCLKRRTLTTSGAAPTELTAEQLAGSINNAGSGNDNQNTTSVNGTSGGGTTAATRTRRTRRPRRTPSQISTHSLPAYAKEPGEQELVILQMRQDMEDGSIPQPLATVVDLNDDAEDSMDGHPRLRYTPVPETPTNAPLLQDDPTGDLSVRSPDSISIELHRRSGSVGTTNDSTDTTSLARVESRGPETVADARGDAPPYFEVIGQTGGENDHIPRRSLIDAGPHNTPLTPVTSTDTVPSPPSPQQDPPQRRSGFRSLLNRMSAAGTSLHARNDSSASANSSFNSHTRGPSGTSILGFRALSRQKSITSHNGSRANLTSPSMISLSSISAPLTHTALRTEFTYPRSGPTPEQMKLIASRDSLVRFGVPYGPDAMAFASLSRVDLVNGERPPDFEVAVEGSSLRNGDEENAAAGPPSRRSGEGSRTQDEPALNSTTQNPNPEETAQPTPVDDIPIVRDPVAADVEGVPTAAQVSVTSDPVPQKEANDNDVRAEVVNGHEMRGSSQEEASPPVVSSGHESANPAHKDLVTVEETASPNTPAFLSPKVFTPAQPMSPPPTGSQPTPPVHPEPFENSSSSNAPSDQTAKPPPSSYHPPPASELHPHDGATLQRSGSRASQLSYTSFTSYASDMTYRTAAESLSSRRMVGNATPSRYDESDEDEDGNAGVEETDGRPSTPTLGGRAGTRHRRESTDATITGSMANPRAPRTKQARHISTATITQA